jgi:hypothetical protein
MEKRLLPTVENEVKRYQDEHRGERPLYIVMQSDDADVLMREVKEVHGYDEETIVTEFNGSKIVKHSALNPGQIQLTNELPEMSS